VHQRHAEGKRSLTYSPKGLLIGEEAPDGALRSYGYNRRGELTKADSDGTGFDWERDAVGNIVAESLHVGGRSYTVENTLDVAGDCVALRSSLGHERAIKRDAAGHVSELWTGNQRLLGISRDAMLRPSRVELQAGGAVLNHYDAGQRLRRRQVVGPGADMSRAGEPDWIGNAAPGVFETLFDYTPVNELHKVSGSDGTDIEYSYDVRRRLTQVRRHGDSEELSFDATGNHYEKGPDAPVRVYGSGNQLTQRGQWYFSYDDRGQLVEKRRTLAGSDVPEVTRFSYDSWGLLAAVDLPDGTRVEFGYDAFARRLSKRTLKDRKVVGERHYVWDRVSLLHDVDVADDSDEPSVVTYLYEEHAEGVPIGHSDGEGWVHYVADANGTPDAIVDGAGRIVGKIGRDTYGKARLEQGSVDTLVQYPGQYLDRETGLHYNRYRYYDPDSGRYLTPDPIGFGGGFNHYAYGPNPIGWCDPMGWRHRMTVQTSDEDFLASASRRGGGSVRGTGGSEYQSGWAGEDNRCPSDLRNQTNSHTEQKFCRDLRRFNDSRGGGQSLQGRNYRLTGQYPPCATCHRVMRETAAETGANISYSWEQPAGQSNTVRYSGDSNPRYYGGAGRDLQSHGHSSSRYGELRDHVTAGNTGPLP